MYHYRNKKSGAVIKTPCEVVGKNWESIENTQQPPIEDPPVDDSMMEEAPIEETPEEEPVAGEAPAEKPKATRRGKK